MKKYLHKFHIFILELGLKLARLDPTLFHIVSFIFFLQVISPLIKCYCLFWRHYFSGLLGYSQMYITFSVVFHILIANIVLCWFLYSLIRINTIICIEVLDAWFLKKKTEREMSGDLSVIKVFKKTNEDKTEVKSFFKFNKNKINKK